ncbi:MAG: cyclic nucleotide-binding domain-containing protein [Spirochaetia bacterium]|nr:cyclic nucleotide-binding domain-containing protein [Spirochaetia bacterium]
MDERSDDEYPETRLVRFAKGAELFREGAAGRDMYIIRGGRVRVEIDKDGRKVPITELGKGCHVGEMSFIAAIPRTATVTALEPVIANRISPDVLADEELGISGWTLSIARVLVDRIKRTTELLGDYMAEGPHPVDADDSPSAAASRLDFVVASSEATGIVALKGALSKERVDQVKEAVRLALLKRPEGVTVDFSGIIDIDSGGLSFLLELSKDPRAREGRIHLSNLQLIRNKVAGMKEIRRLVETTKLPARRLEPGEHLIRQGERERSMFIVRSGELDILEERDGAPPLPLGKARAGDVVGELSLLREGERAASVRASVASIVHEITPKEFYANAYATPDWFMRIIDGLVKRLRRTDELLAEATAAPRPPAPDGDMPTPLGIAVDGSRPGTFALSGTMNLANIEQFAPMVRHLVFHGQKQLTLDLAKVERIDRDSIRYLLDLYMLMKENGGNLVIRGNQEYLVWLKKQGGADTIAGLRDEPGKA